MDNHYHLQIETPQANLVKAISRLQGNYSIRYNLYKKRSGHVFEGRYKAIIIEKDEYLLEVNRYLHLNPVIAGIVKYPEEYAWSSYNAYINNETGNLVDSGWVLDLFDEDRGKAIEKYKTYVLSKISEDEYNPFKKLYGGYVLGSKEFVEKIKKGCAEKYISNEVSKRSCIKPRISKEKILEIVKNNIINNDKLQKKVIIYLLRKYTDMSTVKIGKEYKLHYSSIVNTIRRNKTYLENNIMVKKIEKEIIR